MMAWLQGLPEEANSDTSGTSRAPSAGFPKMPACQLGLLYPTQVVSSVKAKLALPAPFAQLLGPPLPAPVLRKSDPVALLQKPAEPTDDENPSK
jgi:hypothetical protein